MREPLPLPEIHTLLNKLHHVKEQESIVYDDQLLLHIVVDKDNHWLCQWTKKAYSEGKRRQIKRLPDRVKSRFADQTNKIEKVFTMKKDKDVSSLEHTSWRCQYHVVFAPKYRRMEIYGETKQDIGIILCKLCQQKGVEIIEAQACSDHIHMLISMPPKHSVSQIMGYLKGKSSLMIFDRYANLKYKYGNRHFWARGYYVDNTLWSGL